METNNPLLESYSHDAATAQRLMNQWGAERRPFFFVVDYRAAHFLVVPLDEWPGEALSFAFSGRKGSGFSPIAAGENSEFAEKISENFEKNSELSQNDSDILWETIPPSFDDYAAAFAKVQHHLHRGDSFLTNLTFAVPVRTNVSLASLYARAQAPYKLLWPGYFVCFSPEPFVEISDGSIRTFPMKGTIDATLPNAEATLLADPKEQAEHATIVDLLRNDLSQVATEVHVARYRYVEQIVTHRGALLQTSSEIVGRLPDDYLNRLGDILMPLLPAGSITGAPKLATIASIAAAETYDRDFYTGVMGCFDGTSLQSAVMIRFLEQTGEDSFVFKAGGGITTQSDVHSEYDELLVKVYAPI